MICGLCVESCGCILPQRKILRNIKYFAIITHRCIKEVSFTQLFVFPQVQVHQSDPFQLERDTFRT